MWRHRKTAVGYQRRATTRYSHHFRRQRHARCEIEQKDRKVAKSPSVCHKTYRNAGATAGIDLTLSLIEEDYGARVALTVARELVVYLKRPGGQEQYSEPLQFQTQSISRLSELATWMLSHLHEDLSVEALAAKACLCPRHFSRRFKVEFGTTPADFVERLRLDEARRRLSNGDNSVENVGTSVGFKSSDAFRRAFERRLGVNPSDYRRRFATSSSSSAPVDRRRDANGFTKAA